MNTLKNLCLTRVFLLSKIQLSKTNWEEKTINAYKISPKYEFPKEYNILPYSIKEELQQIDYCCIHNDCNRAAINGHLDCLKKDANNITLFTTNLAAYNGQLECLKWLYNNGFPINRDTYNIVVRNDHFTCLIFLTTIVDKPIFDHLIFDSAVCFGKIEAVKFLHKISYPADSSIVCFYAAINNQLECLKFLVENNYPCSTNVLKIATDNKFLECVEFLKTVQ